MYWFPFHNECTELHWTHWAQYGSRRLLGYGGTDFLFAYWLSDENDVMFGQYGTSSRPFADKMSEIGCRGCQTPLSYEKTSFSFHSTNRAVVPIAGNLTLTKNETNHGSFLFSHFIGFFPGAVLPFPRYEFNGLLPLGMTGTIFIRHICYHRLNDFLIIWGNVSYSFQTMKLAWTTMMTCSPWTISTVSSR